MCRALCAIAGTLFPSCVIKQVFSESTLQSEICVKKIILFLLSGWHPVKKLQISKKVFGLILNYFKDEVLNSIFAAYACSKRKGEI